MEKQRWEESEKRREEERREWVRRKKMQAREKIEKSRFTTFFQWFVAPAGRKVGSIKRRVRSHLARWDEKLYAVVARSTFRYQNAQNTSASETSKKCTPLRCEAHLEVKTYKTQHVRTIFRSWDVEKVHAVVARSTFPSQNVQSTPTSEHFWKLRSKKCWREAHFQVNMLKAPHAWTTFEGSDVVSRGRKGFCTLPKVSKPWRSCSMAGVGHLQRICKDAFRVAHAVQETCSSEMLGPLGGQGADFRRGVAFWSIRSVGLLRWFCVTGAALRVTWHHFFLAGAIL